MTLRGPVCNKDLGPCVIVWDPSGDNIEFKQTHGGVIFRYEELRVGIKRDQEGLTDVDEVTTGAVNPELDAPLTEPDLTKLVRCFANSTAAVHSLAVNNPVGEAVFARARRVIVKPIENGVISIDPNNWLYIHRAFPRITMEQPYDNAGQRCTKVTFKGFPDDISGRQRQMWRYGPRIT